LQPLVRRLKRDQPDIAEALARGIFLSNFTLPPGISLGGPNLATLPPLPRRAARRRPAAPDQLPRLADWRARRRGDMLGAAEANDLTLYAGLCALSVGLRGGWRSCRTCAEHRRHAPRIAPAAPGRAIYPQTPFAAYLDAIAAWKARP
jgi:hypothetical protein